MTDEHTPGPWIIKGTSMETGSISVGPEDLRIVIAYVTNAASFGDFVSATLKGRRDFGAPDTAFTQQANARLIAAAPEMLSYLEALYKGAKILPTELRALIDKARHNSLAQAQGK